MHFGGAADGLNAGSPSPARRSSYQPYASAMSCSASGAMMSSAAIAAANPPLDLVPGEPRRRVVQEVGLPPGQFLLLPVVDGDCLGRCRQVIPEVFDQLELFGRA